MRTPFSMHSSRARIVRAAKCVPDVLRGINPRLALGRRNISVADVTFNLVDERSQPITGGSIVSAVYVIQGLLQFIDQALFLCSVKRGSVDGIDQVLNSRLGRL